MVVMSKLAETTQYNKTKRRQGPPKPGSAAWAAAEKNPKIAQAGRAKRGDAGAILKAGQKRASYGGWKEKPGAMKRWQDAVTKRLTWEKRNNWDGNRQSVPSTMAFSFLAQQYAVDTKAIQGACEKAMARGKFAQYVEQKGARTAVTPKELNPLNPDGLTYEPDEPELYEANKAGASALIPPAIDKAIAGAFSVSCKKEVLEPEDIERGNTWLVGMLEQNEVKLPEACDWLEMGGAPTSWWSRWFKRHPHLSEVARGGAAWAAWAAQQHHNQRPPSRRRRRGGGWRAASSRSADGCLVAASRAGWV